VRILSASILLAALSAAAPDDDLELWRRYGFSGLVISKFNDGLANLGSADVDGDGHGDLVVVNNNESRIEVLLSPAGREPRGGAEPDEINELPEETYFVREPRAVEERVSSVVLADLDGVGRLDLAFVGDSDKLTLVRRGEGEEERTVRVAVDERSPAPDALQAGDLDGDGRDELLLATKTDVVVLSWREDRLEERARVPHVSPDPDGFDLVDVDGDGRLDLLFVERDSEEPLRLRRGRGGLDFGPEQRTTLAPVRAGATADLDGDGAAEVVVIGRRSGRVQVLGFEADAGGGSSLSGPSQIPLGGDGDQDVLVDDLDGDGLADLLVTDPEAARVVVHRGDASGRFGVGTSSPSLVGVTDPHLADVDGDGRDELVLAAPDEGAIGVAELREAGRVAFPRVLAAPGEDLLCLGAADLDGDGVAQILCVTGEGRSRRRERTFSVLEADGSVVFDVALEDLQTDPSALRIVDLDRDGHLDVLVFEPKAMPTLLRAIDVGLQPVALDELPGLGVLEDVDARATALGDVDGDGLDELIAPGPNFARAFHLAAGATEAVVVDQLNIERGGSEVTAVGAGDLDGDGRDEVLLAAGGLFVLEARPDGWARRERIELPGLSPKGVATADLGGDGRADVLLVGEDQVGLLRAGAPEGGLVVRTDYEIPVEDAYLHDLALGDVNGDGRDDVVMIETNEHLVAIAALVGDELVHALRFPVFEEHLFEARRGGREPREVHVGDVTGDGLGDIAVLVHDRVIVYPQEPRP